MKFSEGLFEFPIKIYDSVSVARAMLKDDKNIRTAAEDEEMIESLVPEEADWVRGIIKLPIQQIVGWHDLFPEGKSVKEVSEKGFEETMVITNTLGNYECLWRREKFEERLDQFVEGYTKGIDKMVEEAMAEKRTVVVPKKRNWWKR